MTRPCRPTPRSRLPSCPRTRPEPRGREPRRRAGRRPRAGHGPRRQRPVLRRVLARPPVRADTGHPVRGRRRVPAVLGHVCRDLGPLRRRRRRPQVAGRGRDQGDDRLARRPLLAVPHVRGVQVVARGHLRPVRGHRRHDRDGQRRGRDGRLHHAGRGLLPRGGRAADGIARREGRAAPGRRDRRHRRRDPGRAHRRPGPRQGPRPEGHDGQAADPARRRRSRSRSRSPAR